MSDFMLGALLGALALSAIFGALPLLGLIHVGYGRERQQPEPPPPPEPQRAYPRIGCSITVEEKKKPIAGLKPQMRLFAIVDNEGEIAIRSLKGFWRVTTPDNHKHPSIRIQREVLAPQDKYLDSYLLDDAFETESANMRFDVEVEFDYQAPKDDESRHYTSKFRYDRKSHRMVKII